MFKIIATTLALLGYVECYTPIPNEGNFFYINGRQPKDSAADNDPGVHEFEVGLSRGIDGNIETLKRFGITTLEAPLVVVSDACESGCN